MKTRWRTQKAPTVEARVNYSWQELQGSPYPSVQWRGPITTTTSYSSFPFRAVGTQITESEGHEWPPRNSRKQLDVGGPFSSSRSWIEHSDGFKRQRHVMPWNEYVRISPVVWRKHTGEYLTPVYPISPDNPAYTFPYHEASSDDDLAKYGAEAVAGCSPTNSVANLSVALGELMKEGLPTLVGLKSLVSGRSAPKKGADEFLNIEFGWKPLISDAKKLAHGVLNAERLLRQYERDAGRSVRRSFTFPTERRVNTTENGPATPSASLGNLLDGSTPGTLVRTDEFQCKRWFKGAFTYHLPMGYNSRKEVDRYSLLAKQVLGLELTPETLWNLAPWSWLADWFTNAGDVISNVSDAANDGLVMRYGYMMENTISRTVWGIDGLKVPMAPKLHVPTLSYVFETKKRVRANPFGFGLTDEDLDPRQWAILGALGISRGR